MTVRHTVASLDDEQARDLLLQVARGQEEMRYRPSRMLELMPDALMGAEADEASGAAYMTRGEVGGNRRNTDAYRNYSNVESQESQEQISDTVTVCVTLVTTPGKSRQPR